ncbi:MAG: hypothetical protein KKG99_02270 [Bacteroidetes bacterium]|nr:hypothetical protein [Bacteroidota bacterium]
MKKIIIASIIFLSFNCNAQTKMGDLPQLVDPFPVVIKGNDLVFIDDYSIYVYSLEPYELKAKFAKQGDGSYDLKYTPYFTIQDNIIIATDYLKSIWFTKNSDVIKVKDYKDFPDFNTNMEMVLIPIKENYIRITVSHELSKRYVDLYNSKYEKIKRLYEGLYDWKTPNGKINTLPYRIDVACYQDKIFVTDTEKGFFIKVFDSNGNEIRTIDKNYEIEDVKITENDKNAIAGFIKTSQPEWLYNAIKTNSYYYKNYPKINYAMFSDENIYITTYRKKDNMNEIINLDLNGNIKRKGFAEIKALKLYRGILRFDPYTIDNGFLYEIAKNNDGKWFLYRTSIN